MLHWQFYKQCQCYLSVLFIGVNQTQTLGGHAISYLNRADRNAHVIKTEEIAGGSEVYQNHVHAELK